MEGELEQAYKNADEVQYRRGYRKAIEDSIEFIYEQLQEGTIGCGNIEEFIDNYRKMKDEWLWLNQYVAVASTGSGASQHTQVIEDSTTARFWKPTR